MQSNRWGEVVVAVDYGTAPTMPSGPSYGCYSGSSSRSCSRLAKELYGSPSASTMAISDALGTSRFPVSYLMYVCSGMPAASARAR